MDLTKNLLTLAIGGSTGVLWLLIGLSLASVAIMIERGLTFYQSRFNEEKFFSEIEPLLQQGDWSEALSRCEADKAAEPQILLTGLLQVHNGKEAVQEAMKGERTHVGLQLGKRLSFLGTLGANAPFIGLFGTVLGIIHAFKDLTLTEGGGGPAVMAGIAEALVATAVGLLVAIPAVLMFNFFHRRLHVVLERSERLSQLLLVYLSIPAAASESHTEFMKIGKIR